MRILRGLLPLIVSIAIVCGCGSNGGGIKAPSALSYTAGTIVITKGVAITPDNPTSSGGPVTAYAVSPALPAGLSLNSGTGIVSGIPMVVAATATYSVTAFGGTTRCARD